MNPIEYVESVKERLSTDSIVISFDAIREFASLEEGFIRVRAKLTNGDILDFSEFVQWLDDLELISYRYQWMDKDKTSFAVGITLCTTPILKTSRIMFTPAQRV